MNWLKELIVSYRCKYWNQETSYPSCILPYKHYKLIDINELSKIENCYIVRRSDKSSENSFIKLNGTYILREDVIFTKELNNLSMNLFGGRFTDLHLIYKCSGKGMEPWNFKSINLKKFKDNYSTIDNEHSPIYFRIQDLDKKQFPYYRTNDKNIKGLLTKLNIDPTSDEKVRLKGETRIEHTPNNLNFWHVELKLLDVESKELKSISSGWQKSVAEHAYKDIVSKSAKPKPIKDIYQISKNYYTK